LGTRVFHYEHRVLVTLAYDYRSAKSFIQNHLHGIV
jgi:hypothetical protein